MNNPYRAMTAELLAALEMQLGLLRFDNRLCIRARALLDQQVAEMATDEELDELYFDIDARHVASWRPYARAVLAKWGLQ